MIYAQQVIKNLKVLFICNDLYFDKIIDFFACVGIGTQK